MKDKILHRLQKIFQDSFWKNVITLFSGSALAQLVPILIFPLVTRMYPKEELGVYFLYSSVILLSQIMATFQFQFAIVLPKEKKEANALFLLNLILSIISSSILALLIYVFYEPILTLVKEERFVDCLYFIPLSTFLLGIFNAGSYFLNRVKDYRSISIAKIIKAISLSGFQLAFGIWGSLSMGLIYGLVVGQVLSMIYIFIIVLKHDSNVLNFNRKLIWEQAKKYKDIPLFNSLISFLNNLSNQMPVFLITRYFGVGPAGDYGLANKIVSTPSGLVAHSVGQVFYQESSDIVNKKGDLKEFVKKTYRQLFRISIIPFLILMLIAPWLFKVVFSESYFIAGKYTQILIPWFFLNFLNTPVSFLFTTLNRQKALLTLNTVLLGARFIALFSGYYFYESIYIALLFFMLVSVVYYVFMYWYLIRLSAKQVWAYEKSNE